MLRIKIEALTLKSEKYWYLGSLFDGFAFDINPDATCSAVYMSNGEVAGDCSSLYFHHALPLTSIDLTGFTEQDVEDLDGEIRNGQGLSYTRDALGFKLALDGEPFTGLAYKFYGVFCVREYGYKDGVAVTDARWHPDGQLLELWLENEVDECYAWYPDGGKEVALISLVKVHPDRGAERIVSLSLRFASNDKLKVISATGTCDALEQLIASHALFPLRQLSEVSGYAVAEHFVVFDGDITFQLFKELARNGRFCATVELHLPADFLMQEVGIAAVEDMRALRKVSFTSSDGRELDAARALKYRRPDLQIDAYVAD